MANPYVNKVVINGVTKIDITGVTVTPSTLQRGITAVDKSGATITGEAELVPRLIGEVVAFSGSTVPAGYLKCSGQSVSRTTYSALYAAIGTTYGSASSTTFYLPNYSGQALIYTGKY